MRNEWGDNKLLRQVKMELRHINVPNVCHFKLAYFKTSAKKKRRSNPTTLAKLARNLKKYSTASPEASCSFSFIPSQIDLVKHISSIYMYYIDISRDALKFIKMKITSKQ